MATIGRNGTSNDGSRNTSGREEAEERWRSWDDRTREYDAMRGYGESARAGERSGNVPDQRPAGWQPVYDWREEEARRGAGYYDPTQGYDYRASETPTLRGLPPMRRDPRDPRDFDARESHRMREHARREEFYRRDPNMFYDDRESLLHEPHGGGPGAQHAFDRARMGTLGGGEHTGLEPRRTPAGYGYERDEHAGLRGAFDRFTGRMEEHHGERHEHGHGMHRAAAGGIGAGLVERFRRWRHGSNTARDVMTKNPKTARATDTVRQIEQIMIDEDTGIVPVTDENGRLLGVVTDRDIVCRLVARGADLSTTRVSEAMTRDVECVTEQADLHDVLRIMSEHQVRRVPVVGRGDRLVGIIAMADIAREADVDQALQGAFEEISSSRAFWSRLR